MMFDGRQMPDDRELAKDLALAWFSVIGDLDVPDALEAVRRHYMTSRKWAMPVDIREGVRAIRQERARLAPQVHEIRELPSPFEKDVDKAARTERGAGQARTALQQVFEAMAKKNGSQAARSAVEEMRELIANKTESDKEGEARD
jgi:hypothetical protein